MPPDRMITLFGATGYTGRLIAQALTRAELPFRLAGRSAEKLACLSDALPSKPTWLTADATRSETLAALCRGTRVLINCAGPFTDLGEPVAAHAALAGVHYLDSANELGFAYRLRSYDALARKSRAAVVPACGFEVALADCAAAALAAALSSNSPAEALDEVNVTYALSGRGTSLGTRRSAVRAVATSWIGYEAGKWTSLAPGARRRQVSLPGGPRPALSFPSCEIVTIPSHVFVRAVSTWMTITPFAYWWAPVLVPLFARLAAGPVGWLTLALISRVALPPETGLRSQAPFSIKVEAQGQAGRATLVVAGRGVYDLTADIVAYAAEQMLQPGYNRSGVLAPATALDPQALLDQAAAHWNVTVEREAALG
jgi:short subunit dehydrogenase-like uncharacterized protein